MAMARAADRNATTAQAIRLAPLRRRPKEITSGSLGFMARSQSSCLHQYRRPWGGRWLHPGYRATKAMRR